MFAGEEIATVGVVEDLARALARSLEEAALPDASLVGLTAPNGPGVLAAFVALRRAGLVPLLMDACTPPAEQARSGRRLGTAAVLQVDRPWPRSRGDWRLEATPGSDPRALPGVGAVKRTSGSTGEPRGVANSPAALVADAEALSRTMGFREGDRLLAAIPLTHAYGLGCLLLPALLEGLPLVLPQADAGPAAPLAAARRHDATVFPTVPAYLQALLRLPEAPAWPVSLRLVISAGAPLQPATAAGFRERFGVRVHAFYGASEAGGICYDRDGGAAERGSVGTPVDGVRLELAADAAEPAGIGLVTVRSAAVASSYLPEGSARLAAGCFVSDDLGRMERGELFLVGRRSEWINVEGHKVQPREVEAVLCSHPGVEDAVVVGAPLPGRAGESLRAIVAVATGVTYLEIIAWCRERLAPHKVPRRLRIVDSIPRNARGKVDRAAVLGLTDALDPASTEA